MLNPKFEVNIIIWPVFLLSSAVCVCVLSAVFLRGGRGDLTAKGAVKKMIYSCLLWNIIEFYENPLSQECPDVKWNLESSPSVASIEMQLKKTKP